MADINIAGVMRAGAYSPNHIGNDTAIFNAVAEQLRKRGCIVNTYSEEQFNNGDIKEDIIMNTLKTIQTLAKIGKVFSKIIFVCCIVGFCGCIVGIVSLAFGAETFKLGGVTIHSMIENEAGMSLPTLYASMAVGLLFCGAEAVLCKFAEAYFKHELLHSGNQTFTKVFLKETGWQIQELYYIRIQERV